jgi:hypothetical protein
LDGLDCAPTKALHYPYGLEIISKTGDYWYSAVKQLLPATAIWNEAQFTLKNNAFHKPKYAYRKYSLGGVSDAEVSSCITSIVPSNESSFLSVVYWSEFEASGALLQSAEFTDGNTIVTVNPIDKDLIPDGNLFAADLQAWLDVNGGGTVTWLTPSQTIPNVFVPTVSGYYLVVQSNTQRLTTAYYDTGGEPIANDANISCTNNYTIESDYQYISSLKINGTEVVPLGTLWDMSTAEGVIAAGTTINNFISGLAYALTDIYYLFMSLPNCEDIVLTTINSCPDNMPTIECKVLSDGCASEEFSSLDELLDFSFGNVECTSIYSGGTFGYSGGNGDGYFSGRLVQYSVNENGENVIEDYIGFDDYICITGEPIPTGTTCESVVILPNLSYECITVEGINTGFATVTIAPTGGQAPYTAINAFDPDAFVIIAEGGSFSYEKNDGDIISLIVVDANGCIADAGLSTITINCPADCGETPLTIALIQDCVFDEISGNTGVAFVTYLVTGGVEPYIVEATVNGLPFDIDSLTPVNHGDIVIATVSDATSCPPDTDVLIINCPSVLCSGVTIELSGSTVCDRDENGYYLGTGILALGASGGTAPYTFTDAFTMAEVFDGQSVSDGQSFEIFVTDANGCISENILVTVDCPTNCEVMTFNEQWNTSTYYPSGIITDFLTRFIESNNIPEISNYALEVVSHVITVNSINNGTIVNSLPPNIPVTSWNITSLGQTQDFYIEYPDSVNRVSNINLTNTLILTNGCTYEKTYTITVDGNSIILTTVVESGTLTLL